MSGEWTRRRFVGSMGTVVGVALLPACGPDAESIAKAELLASGLENPDSWRAVGEAYLATDPPERRLDRIVRAVEEDLGLAVEAASVEALPKRIAARVREEFRNGATVEVDGWVLATTEARIAALVFLA